MNSLDAAPVTLTGAVATLAPLDPSHAPGLLRLLEVAPEIWEFLPVARPATLGEMGAWVEGALAAQTRGERLAFVVLHNGSGQVIGSTSYFDISAEHRHLEIGWTWYARDHWRTAVNTECKYLLLRHAFEELGCIRVQLRTDERNLRSRAAIERIGGKLEGIIREDRILPDGFHRSSAQFSLLASEWPERRAWFEARLGVSAS